jgi:hypothetical protein
MTLLFTYNGLLLHGKSARHDVQHRGTFSGGWTCEKGGEDMIVQRVAPVSYHSVFTKAAATLALSL